MKPYAIIIHVSFLNYTLYCSFHMKIKRFKSLLPCMAVVVIASMLAPVCLLSPLSARADAGIMRWDTVSTPNSVPGRNDVLNPWLGGDHTGSEVRDLAVGSDGKTLLAAVTVDGRYINLGAVPVGVLMVSANGGISWNTAVDQSLRNAGLGGNHVYNIAIASDDPKYWAVTTGTVASGPTQFWVTTDAGVTWNDTQAPAMGAGEAISAMDISIDYGNGRDLVFVTRSGAGNGRFFVMRNKGFGSWVLQTGPIAPFVDYFKARFSPTYSGDSSIALVYCDALATYYNVAFMDVANSMANTWAFPGNGIEVKSVASAVDASPSFTTLASADLSLPSDFSGQSASLRRAFISLNVPAPAAVTNESGIFRIDDTVPAVLFSTTSGATLQINSIAFFGTYASGKLMAGLVWGIPCNAVVPTIFADTPCTCAGSCGYRSLKPPTGAANQGSCSDNMSGIGAAVVGWSPNGSLAYAITGSGMITNGLVWWNSGLGPWISTLIPNDETAFSISRSNGDTWNQLSLIDTTIDWFNDVAVSADCTTLYLASVHRNVGIGCNEFDSVWRSTISPGVAAPLPAISPIGTYWERVLVHTTSISCSIPQTDLPILRTVPSCTDSSDGGLVGWAARFAPSSLTGGGLMAWSPDYGDYWVAITPRYLVEDFTFDSSRVIYVAGITGMVQKLVYTGTAWSTNLPGAYTGVIPHTITARNGKVLVGANLISTLEGTPIAYSADSGANFQTYRDNIPVKGMVHAIFDTDFEKNRFIYAAVGENVTGTVYRNNAPVFTRWTDNDMMDVSNGATGADWSAEVPPVGPNPPHQRGFFGIVMAFTGNDQPALYAAHDNITTNHFGIDVSNSAVCRTLEPRNGMPKPGVYWDCLDVFQPPATSGVRFTLEPSSLKACGCCSLNTNTTLYAIDNESGFSLDSVNITFSGDIAAFIAAWSAVLPGHYLQVPGYNPPLNQGMLWAYTDCLAKKGPALRTPADKALVGADPVTGRNQQIDLSWEQLCLTTVYLLQVAKDPEFTLRVNPAVSNANSIAAVTGDITLTMDQTNMTSPAAWLSPGSLPEAGATYYWHICSYQSATGQIAVSPYSETRSFTVKAGFIVNTPYYGVQLLAPDNGCASCRVRPALFSWSPWKEATRYEFVLSKDSEFKQVLKQANTSSTGYEYDGTLDYDTNYFWRVRAVEVNGQPIPSDWSATFSFRTEPAPESPAPLPGDPETPLWVWGVIGLGTLLVIVTLILILRTGR